MTTASYRTRILKVNCRKPEKQAIKLAVEILKDGGLVAFPTETVYGLGAEYSNKSAVKRIYEVKDRPKNKPLTLHISDMTMLNRFVDHIPELAGRLIKRFWPGPLTLVLKSKKGKKIGFRMPKNKVALQLISNLGSPIVAPSANLSGKKAPTSAKDVAKSLSDNVDLILDGGKTHLGRESTVVDASVFPCKILREGAVSKAAISDAWHVV